MALQNAVELVTFVLLEGGPDETIYKVDKNVLIQKSDFFKALLTSSSQEKATSRFSLKDVSEQTFDQYLHWVVKGEVLISAGGMVVEDWPADDSRMRCFVNYERHVKEQVAYDENYWPADDTDQEDFFDDEYSDTEYSDSEHTERPHFDREHFDRGYSDLDHFNREHSDHDHTDRERRDRKDVPGCWTSTGNFEAAFQQLSLLWIFANRVGDTKLRNGTIDALRRVSFGCSARPGLETINIVWKKTSASCTLRNLFLDQVIFTCGGDPFVTERVADLDPGFVRDILLGLFDDREVIFRRDVLLLKRCHYHEHNALYPADDCPKVVLRNADNQSFGTCLEPGWTEGPILDDFDVDMEGLMPRLATKKDLKRLGRA